MILKILVTLVSFILFIYIFYYKLIKKNDTNYLIILGVQTVGILINFIQIIFGVLKNSFWNSIMFLLAIIIPILVIILEYKNINTSEMLYLVISKTYILLGKDKKAKAYLIYLAKKYPNSYGAHRLLATIYEKEGGMRKAIDEYVKALEIRRNDYKVYYKIPGLLKELGRDDQAILMLGNLLNVKPDHYLATKMISELLLEEGEYKRTISIINKALKYFENDENLIYNLGIAYASINEFSLAKKCFEQVISINNENYDANYRLGQIALLYREFDMAEECFLKSAFKQKEAKSYYELTKIYIIKNKKETAANYVQKAINIDGSFYKKAKEEPMFFPIKQQIRPPQDNIDKKIEEESKTEIMIEEYLSNTYNLTKVLAQKEEEKKKNNNWKNKKKKG